MVKTGNKAEPLKGILEIQVSRQEGGNVENVKLTTAATPQRTCVAQRKGSVVYKHHGIVTTHLFSRSSGDWG